MRAYGQLRVALQSKGARGKLQVGQNPEMNPGKRVNVMEAFMQYGLYENFPQN